MSLKFVIVGHVDHGKSTLIGRLLYDTDSLPEGKIEEIEQTCKALGKEIEFGYIMDSFQEEREQGLTIDTSQIFFNTEKRQYVIIDAPGHVKFTKNMITGASQAEAALLMVDASEGVQEQTRRHSYILSLLGIKQIIVVINKMDLVEYDENKFIKIEKDIKEFLSKININPSYIIPVSSFKGDNIANKSENMKWYSGQTILEALDSFNEKKNSDDMPLRLPVQDVYNFDDRIIVGRIESGKIKEGDDILITPSGEKTIINKIKIYKNENKKEAFSGESIGIITNDKVFLDRGDIITKENQAPEKVKKINSSVFWMSKKELKKNDLVKIKLATQETMGKIVSIKNKIDSSTLEIMEKNSEILKNMEAAEIQIEFQKEICTDKFNKIPEMGRFVIEKDYDTAGGGIIIG